MLFSEVSVQLDDQDFMLSFGSLESVIIPFKVAQFSKYRKYFFLPFVTLYYAAVVRHEV